MPLNLSTALASRPENILISACAPSLFLAATLNPAASGHRVRNFLRQPADPRGACHRHNFADLIQAELGLGRIWSATPSRSSNVSMEFRHQRTRHLLECAHRERPDLGNRGQPGGSQHAADRAGPLDMQIYWPFFMQRETNRFKLGLLIRISLIFCPTKRIRDQNNYKNTPEIRFRPKYCLS